MIASVVVPTHNRADSIVRTVKSLFAQRGTDGPFEILVLDNASTDGTFEAVSALVAGAPFPLRVIREPALGVHNARHAGARAASSELLLYTDDDVTFAEWWVTAWVREFRNHPDMAAAGGPVDAVWESPPPQWVVDYMSKRDIFTILATIRRGDRFLLEPDGIFFSNNMAIRRDVLFRMGGFNPEAYGKVWIGDGETGLNHRLWEAKLRVGWVPDALAFHHIPSSRMSAAYFRHRLKNEGACDVYREYRGTSPSRFAIALKMAHELRHGIRPWLRSLGHRDGTDERALGLQLDAALHTGRVRYLWWLMTNGEMRRMVRRTDWMAAPRGETAPAAR